MIGRSTHLSIRSSIGFKSILPTVIPIIHFGNWHSFQSEALYLKAGSPPPLWDVATSTHLSRSAGQQGGLAGAETLEANGVEIVRVQM